MICEFSLSLRDDAIVKQSLLPTIKVESIVQRTASIPLINIRVIIINCIFENVL